MPQARRKIGPDEHDHSGDPDRQPDLAPPRDVMIAQQQTVEHEKPQRRYRKQNTDRRQMAKLARRKTNAASSQRTVSEHHRARDQETRRAHDARRNLLDGDADAKISRAPENIDQREGNNDLPSASGSGSNHESSSAKNSEYQSAAKGLQAESYTDFHASDHIPISPSILPAASAPDRTQSGTPMPL